MCGRDGLRGSGLRKAESAFSGAAVNRALWGYSAVLSGTTLVSWTRYWLKGREDTRPLFGQADRYHDLTNYAGKIANLHAGAKALATGLPVFNYPAPAAYVYDFFLGGFGGHALRAFLIVLGMCVLVLTGVAFRAAGREGRRLSGFWAAVLTTAVLGLPLWWTADRANLEGVVWALAAGGVCAFLGRRYGWSAVLVGAAGSIKPFPLLFLGLLIAHRRYKEAAAGCGVAAGLILIALVCLGGNPVRTYGEMKPGVNEYLADYVRSVRPSLEERVYHSLLDGAKMVMVVREAHSVAPLQVEATDERLSAIEGGWTKLRRADTVYVPCVVVLVLALVPVFWSKPVLNQVTALSVLVALIPLAAAEYTLLHVYVAAGAFFVFLAREVSRGTASVSRRGAWGVLGCYGLLLAPLSFLKIYQGFAQMILLVVLLALAAAVPMHSPELDVQP